MSETRSTSNRDAAIFYDAVAEAFDAEYYGPDGDPLIQVDVSRFRRLLDLVLPTHGITLELGSGTGEWLRWLSRRKQMVAVGVDISEEMCRKARSLGCEHVVVADLASLPFRDGVFDAVIAPYCALDHVQEYERAFNEVDRVAKSSAQVALMVDNADRFVSTYWRVRYDRVQSLGGNPKESRAWKHRVDGVEVEVFTKMFTVGEVRRLLPNFALDFLGIGFLTPLVPLWARRRHRIAFPLSQMLRPVENVLSRWATSRAALLVAYGRTRADAHERSSKRRRCAGILRRRPRGSRNARSDSLSWFKRR